MRRKIMATVITAAMALSMLTGCGSSGNAPAATAAAKPAETTEAKQEAGGETSAAASDTGAVGSVDVSTVWPDGTTETRPPPFYCPNRALRAKGRKIFSVP